MKKLPKEEVLEAVFKRGRTAYVEAVILAADYYKKREDITLEEMQDIIMTVLKLLNVNGLKEEK